MLSEFAPGLFLADGPVVPFFTFPYPTRMAVIRLGDGGLFVWSPIALSADLSAEIDALGPVRHLVSPNPIHHLWLGDWMTAYPEARLYAPPGLRRKRKDLSFDAELGDGPEAPWRDQLDQVQMRGSLAMTEVVFFHQASRTALFADLIENFPPGWFEGWRGALARLDGIVAPHPGAPREWRASFVRRKAARAALQRILAWPIERVVVAHGDCVETDGAAFVRRAFAWLA